MPLTVRTRALTKKSTQKRAFFSAHGEAILKEVAKTLYDHANNTVIPALRDVEDTVPRRPKQIYIRTGNISRGWHTEPRSFDLDAIGARSSALIVKIVNDVKDTGGGYKRYGRGLTWIQEESANEEYADKVMGERQGYYHIGRWPKAREIIARYAPGLQGKVRTAVSRGLKGAL